MISNVISAMRPTLPPTKDGYHLANEVVDTYRLLWPRVAQDGWYVIEDLACMFHTKFGGDETGGRVGSLVGRLTADAVAGRVEMHVYQEIAFVKKVG